MGDDRFLTVVAFVEGYNQAFEVRPLDGFREYVAARLLGRYTPLSWAAIIAESVVPSVFEAEEGINSMPPETQLKAIGRLVNLLDDFTASRLGESTERGRSQARGSALSTAEENPGQSD